MFVLKKIFYFFENLSYCFVFPKYYPSDATYINLIRNIFFFLKNFEFLKAYKYLIIIILKIFLFIIQIFYFPLIIIIYFSNFRFVDLNTSQIGALNHHLDIMIKCNYIKKYKSIVLIPAFTEFSFIKKIFKNITIVDNIFLVIFLLPLKFVPFISVKSYEVEHFLDSKLKFMKNAPCSKIVNKYIKNYYPNNLYEFKKEYENKMLEIFKSNFPNINFQKLIIFHNREPYINKTSNLRSSNIFNYIETLKYLSDKNYSIIRLIDSNSKKIDLNLKNLFNLDISNKKNKLLQFYLIKNCYAFFCNSSGPSSLGSLFDKKVFHSNVYGVNTNAINERSMYIPKKVSFDGKIMNFKSLFDLGYYDGKCMTREFYKGRFSLIENNSQEILEGTKEFLNLDINNIHKIQKNFKQKLPDSMEMKYYKSNIPLSFIKLNNKLF